MNLRADEEGVMGMGDTGKRKEPVRVISDGGGRRSMRMWPTKKKTTTKN